MDDRTVILKDVRGIGEGSTLLDGVDEKGDLWVYHRLKGTDACAFCGEVVKDGWTNIRNGAVVCAKHVSISGKMR